MTPTGAPRSTALLTDRYELTMLDAALAEGTGSRSAVFEAFPRDLPAKARYGLIYGADRLVDAIAAFRFGDEELAWLEANGVVSPAGLEWLAAYRFSGDVDAYPDGEAWFPGSPLVEVRASFAEAVVLETLILSILNHGSAIATEAARVRAAAGDAVLIEMGSRRTHEAAAVDAAAAAWMAGFDSTSNLQAGARFGVPTAGTAAHAWTLAHMDGEEDAFAAQIAAQGIGTTLLVDTYDTRIGIDRAVAAARRHGAAGPGAIRLDSGDLAAEAVQARAQLDRLGATGTRICVSGDLDAETIAALRSDGAPIDVYGMGTNLVAVRPVGAVYKLVAIGDAGGTLHAVAKRAPGKVSIGGHKTGWRRLSAEGRATAEVIQVEGAPTDGRGPGRPVTQRMVSAGVDVRPPRSAKERLAAARGRAVAVAAELTSVEQLPVVYLQPAGQPAEA